MTDHTYENHPFYGIDILRDQEQRHINSLLEKYNTHIADENLKKAIYEDLQKEKRLGKIHIPFKVILHQDPYGNFPNYVEVLLDSKV